jgi:hypothetical protein
VYVSFKKRNRQKPKIKRVVPLILRLFTLWRAAAEVDWSLDTSSASINPHELQIWLQRADSTYCIDSGESIIENEGPRNFEKSEAECLSKSHQSVS